MSIHLDYSQPFNLDLTLCCGQTFRWDKLGEWWYGAVGQRIFRIRQVGDRLDFENADIGFVENYFGLRYDLSRIVAQIDRDEHIEAATKAFRGLRILNQEPWECTISYICATYKNIAAIKRMLNSLSRKFGEKTAFRDRKFCAFPTVEQLAKATESDLRRCGLGYRAEYVHKTARMIREGSFDFERLKKAAYSNAREELTNFPGIGPKAADCVLLFSLEKTEAFPVDVWIKRAVLGHYADHFPKEFVRKASAKRSPSNSEYKKLSAFGQQYFGQYAGYAQEYLYHYERTRC